MLKRKKKEKPVLTYEEEHNKHFWRYQKSSRVLIWAGAINFVSLVVSIIQAIVTKESSLFFYFCFGIDDVIFQALALIPFFQTDVGSYFYLASIVLVAMITTAGAVLLSVFASQGKKKWLWAAVIAYAIDALLIIASYFLGENIASIWMMFALHLIVLGFLAIAVREYYKIIEIAVKHGVIKQRNEGEQNGIK